MSSEGGVGHNFEKEKKNGTFQQIRHKIHKRLIISYKGYICSMIIFEIKEKEEKVES